MAKTAAQKKTSSAPAADAAAETTTLRYVGPGGQTSHVFGELEPTKTYTADAALATYLVSKHPDYWQLAAKE